MNTFAAECPHCGCTFQAQESYLGKKGRCSKCGESFVVQRTAMPDISNANIPKSDEVDIPDLPDFNPDSVTFPSKTEKEKTVVSRKFYTLNFIASLYFFIGAVILFGGITISLAQLFIGSAELFLPIFTASTSAGLTMLLFREIIVVILAIEENTRITAEAISQLHK